jgi:hypothetical protein
MAKKKCCKKTRCSKKVVDEKIVEESPVFPEVKPMTKTNFFLDLIKKTFGHG